MPMQAGTRLGPYEILSLIGAGGMGEVYRARDTRLDRTVAVKVLVSDLAGNAQFRTRFAHEVKAISALNHPHICGLFDVGREHDTEYLVLEFLEGETLAARLERGSLPFAQVLRFGIEIADALEAAHRHGIVHRDLKPGNIMLTAVGTKLLDMMSTRLMPSPAAASTPPSQLFASRLWPTPHEPQYAVTDNGQRFLTLEPIAGERNALIFLLNAVGASSFPTSDANSSPQRP